MTAAGKWNLKRAERETNKGFSLVEVLVCIAILAIVSIPILSGMRLSAKLNNDAHKTQKVTAYAQAELEKIKVLSAEEYKKWITDNGGEVVPITTGEIFEKSEKIKNDFITRHPGETFQADKLKQLFEPFECRIKDIKIGNQAYQARILFEPAEYSKMNKGSSLYAYNINVTALGDVAEADGAVFPVISDELTQYEGIQDENGETMPAVVFNIHNRLEAKGITANLADIGKGMTKTFEIEIITETDQVKVKANLMYEYGGVKLQYQVYNASYRYTPTVADASKPEVKEEPGEKGGGNVFLFARPLQCLKALPTESRHCYNSLQITRSGDTSIPIQVYLVRGYYEDSSGSKKEYNFDEIKVDGNTYLPSAGGNMSGFMKSNTLTFYTNIKKSKWDLNNERDEEERMIGKGEYDARAYGVTIEILNEDGEAQAHMETVKVER